jgi:hypothetical protein
MTIRLAWKGVKMVFVFSQRGVVMEDASPFFSPSHGHSRALYLSTHHWLDSSGFIASIW